LARAGDASVEHGELELEVDGRGLVIRGADLQRPSSAAAMGWGDWEIAFVDRG